MDTIVKVTDPNSSCDFQRTHRTQKAAVSKMIATLYGWLLNFLLLFAVLGITAFQLMCLTDLESDYINPYDSASRINMLVLPEYIIQALLSFSFLFTGHWFFFLFCLPYLYFNAKLYMARHHLVDVTEIYNQVSKEKKKRIYKLVYLVILLVLCIFWLLWTIGDILD